MRLLHDDPRAAGREATALENSYALRLLPRGARIPRHQHMMDPAVLFLHIVRGFRFSEIGDDDL